MASVCNWFSVFFCLRNSPKKAIHQVHPNLKAFDQVIVWKGKESAKEQKGGLAYEVILKPASNCASPRPSSPPKDKPLTQEDIQRKLELAQERRESLEAKRLETLAKERARAQEAVAKVIAENEEFSKCTQEKLRRSMEINKENRESQIKDLQERLRDHLKKVEVVCKTSEKAAKELEEKLNNKYEKYEGNRRAQLEQILQKLRGHAAHIEEVCKTSESSAKVTEEKIMQKMEIALKNREEQIRALQDRLKEHEKKIEEVRKNKTLQSSNSVEDDEK